MIEDARLENEEQARRDRALREGQAWADSAGVGPLTNSYCLRAVIYGCRDLDSCLAPLLGLHRGSYSVQRNWECLPALGSFAGMDP